MHRWLRFLFLGLAGPLLAVAPGDGPGGVGTTDGLSALELWVKADALALTSGSAVADWPDASGNGRSLTQGSTGLRPVFVSGSLNGLPVVRFTADYFGSLTLPSTGNEFALVAVVKPKKTGAYHNIIDDEDSGRPMLWIDSVGNYEFSFNTGAVAPVGSGFDIVFAIKRDSGPQYSQLYLNGPGVTAGSGVNYPVAASETYDLFNRDGGQAFSGDLAELMIFSTALTTEEIGKIGYYLKSKYALAAPFVAVGPVFSGYQSNPAIYGVGEVVVPNSPQLTGAVASGFSIAPPLPAGLGIDPVTGVIAGTPLAVAPMATYIVTATFAANPSASTALSLEVTASMLTGYSRSPAIFTRLRPADPIQPQWRGGSPTGYSIAPALPTGLVLDGVTGEISGTPTAVSPSAPYTVTAHFAGQPDSSIDLALEVLELSSTLDITEFLASNAGGLADGHGARSDWIEIHNYGTVPIDLGGWWLTDTAADLTKWRFPAGLLPPGGYRVVFATGDAHTDPAGYDHTNFKLDAAGEYLALVAPDGVAVARDFAPTYPPQSVDISYGTNDRIVYGAYAVMTPGAPNGFFDSVTARVSAEPAGRTFVGSQSVTLSANLPAGGVIRYTVNNTAPTAASTLYSGAIAIAANTRVRARVFQTGLNPGPEMSEAYLRLGTGVDTFSSNLPLIFLHTDGPVAGAASTTLTGTNAVIVDVDSASGRAAATGSADYSGRSGLRIRGRSSQSFPQKQYKFETWDDAGREAAASLLGLPEESDWVLYAPYTDKALVRNALAYRTWDQLGWRSLRTRFVEVFLNSDGDSQFTYADDYAGIYMLVESPTLPRLGMEGPENSTNPADLTGGYVMEMGNADDQDFSTSGSGRAVAHRHRDPGRDDLTAVQRSWLSEKVNTFERALYGTGFVHPGTGLSYRDTTDVASQVDYKIVREWSRNFDGGSTYYHVPHGGVLTMGPLWDYNWAFGNVNYAEGGDLPGYRTDGWNRSFTAAVNGWSPWWLRLEQDPDWWQQFIDRWTDLRDGPLSDLAVGARLDELTQPLAAEAAARNFAKWPQLGQFTVVSPPGYATRTTYQSEVEYLRKWVRDRSAWIDTQFPPRPAFTPAPGGIVSGATVTLTAGAGQTLYYTINGGDPRLPGGAIAPTALSVPSGGIVTVSASVHLLARARAGTVWGPPRTGAFVTGTPASAANLVVSELSYHPSDPTVDELAVGPSWQDDDFEFVELLNVSAGPVDLTGVAFTEGLRFVFPAGTVLPGGSRAVVVQNAAAFARRYGGAVGIAGTFTGHLDNDGDTVVVRAADGSDIARFRYESAWTHAADGGGHTLNLRDLARSPTDYGRAAAWGLSAEAQGSPGVDNGPVFASDYDLWRASQFSPADLALVGRSGPLADPDGDGADNLLEFALATDPLSGASAPETTLVITGAGVDFTFTRRRQVLGCSFVVEQWFGAVPWAPVMAPLNVVSQSPATETITVSPAPVASDRAFFRLRVSQTD